MTERRGTKALELWCRRITDGYPGVNVQNMTTSWRDGLAFCAMIHHFRPDLIDFDSLNKDDVYGNNELAFRTAAEHLGIPALLDAEDMASCSVPDRLSILTYLSQFYQSFGGSSPSRLALSRTKESSNEGITPVVAESTTPKVGPRMGMRRESCAVCGMPVFLAEKLVISRTPYHRTCFRCARCSNQLSPGNYYETEDGQYCCETCPDEETKTSSVSSSPILHQAYNAAIINERENVKPMNFQNTEISYQRSLSDEEKTVRRAQLTSEILERGQPNIPSSPREENNDRSLMMEKNYAQTSRMRLSFMTNHLLAEKSPEKLVKKSLNEEEYSSDDGVAGAKRLNDSSSPGGGSSNHRDPKGSPIEQNFGDGPVDVTLMPYQCKEHDSSIAIENNLVPNEHSVRDSEVVRLDKRIIDPVDDRLDDKNDIEKTMRLRSFDTHTDEATHFNNDLSNLDDKEISIRQDTKDKIRPDINVDERKDEDSRINKSLSLVQQRLKIFETTRFEGTSREESKVDSSSSPSHDEENTIVADERHERGKYFVEEEASASKNFSLIDSTVVEEKKTSENIEITMKLDQQFPPIVPKRRPPKSSAKKSEITVLNTSGVDLSDDEHYPKDLNPFGSDDDAEVDNGAHEKSRSSHVSTNPFGSSSDDEEEDTSRIVAPPRPATRNISKKSRDEMDEELMEAPTKRRLKAPQISFNPFESDDDEDRETDDEHEGQSRSLTSNIPVPKPRTIKQTPDSVLSPWKNDLNRGDIYASNCSLTSTGSTSTPGGTYRKKKPAPPPPVVKESFTLAGDSPSLISRESNTCTSSNNSLRMTPRVRKAKPAPPPPMPTSNPPSLNLMANITLVESPITNSVKINESRDYETWNDPKNGKDEANRSRQSMTTFSCDETSNYEPYADKSVQGKWKRKKAPAPARPIPHRRKIKVMSLKDVKLELDEIEMQQQGLEKQGVRLEQLIRDKAETGDATEETSLGMDVEELVLELFVLVNEKNELFRRQAELMLLRRQQRLEEEHADIEYQIRCLLCQPEATKTDFDKQREETLIQRLVEIVERRNEIVECLEMDRRREVEEDRSINTQMGIYAAKNKGEFAKELEEEANNRSKKSKKSKLKEKAREKILRKGHKKDADKDVDETEVKLKRQNKKKWF